MGKWITSPKTRKYIYGIAVPVLALLISTGIVTDENGPLIIAIVGAVLVPGLAFSNTDPDQEK